MRTTRLLRGLVGSAVLVAATATGLVAAPAYATHGGSHSDTNFTNGTSNDNTTLDVGATQQTTSTQQGTSTTGTGVAPTGPVEITKHVEACNAANNGGAPIVGALMTVVGCVLDAVVCDAQSTYMWNDTATFQNGQQQTGWTRDGGGCVAPGTATGPVITVQAVVDAASVQAPPAPVHVEPGTKSYVNIPNNYWTTSVPTTKTVTVLNVPIQVTFEPQVTTWSFGDGGSAEGAGIQGAKLGQDGAVEHSYARSGSYTITTTTSYRVTFVLPGAGSQTATLVSPPSPGVTLPVSEIQTRVDATG